MSTQPDRTDLAAGALFVGFGLFFGLQSLGLEIGTPRRMGPGFFPIVLAGILVLLGLIVMAMALRRPGENPGEVAWRGLMFILPAPIFFGFTVRGLGFVPALFVTTLIAGLASRRLGLLATLALAAAVTVFSTLVFSYALGLPFRLFGPWVN
jgi:uncharacterized membrane protein